MLVDPEAASRAHAQRQQRKAQSRKRKQEAFQRSRSAATGFFDGKKPRRQAEAA